MRPQYADKIPEDKLVCVLVLRADAVRVEAGQRSLVVHHLSPVGHQALVNIQALGVQA